jgi:hypothetical protein
MLSTFVDSLRCRSRSLNHRAQKFQIELTRDTVGGTDSERLNLKFESWAPNPDRLSFAIWDDGTIWVDARRSSKNGWDYEFAFYGICSEIDPPEIRDTIERSLWITDAKEMQTLWTRFQPYRK